MKTRKSYRVQAHFLRVLHDYRYLPYFGKTGVILVVNGRRLGQWYRLISIDYWAEKSIKDDEMEERLISRKHVIPNFTDHVIEAYLLIRRSKICTHATILERILKLAEKRAVNVKTHLDVENLFWTYLRNHDETDTLVEIL